MKKEKRLYKSAFEISVEEDSGYYLQDIVVDGSRVSVKGAGLLERNNNQVLVKTGLKCDDKRKMPLLRVNELLMEGAGRELFLRWDDNLLGCYWNIKLNELKRRYGLVVGLLGIELPKDSLENLEAYLKRSEKMSRVGGISQILYKRKKMGWILKILGRQYFFPSGESYLYYFKGIRESQYRDIMLKVGISLERMSSLVELVNIGKIDAIEEKEWLRRRLMLEVMCLKVCVNYLLSLVVRKPKAVWVVIALCYIEAYLVYIIKPVVEKLGRLLKVADIESWRVGDLSLGLSKVNLVGIQKESLNVDLGINLLGSFRLKYLGLPDGRGKLPIVSRRGLGKVYKKSMLSILKLRGSKLEKIVLKVNRRRGRGRFLSSKRVKG